MLLMILRNERNGKVSVCQRMARKCVCTFLSLYTLKRRYLVESLALRFNVNFLMLHLIPVGSSVELMWLAFIEKLDIPVCFLQGIYQCICFIKTFADEIRKFFIFSAASLIVCIDLYISFVFLYF